MNKKLFGLKNYKNWTLYFYTGKLYCKLCLTARHCTDICGNVPAPCTVLVTQSHRCLTVERADQIECEIHESVCF